MKQLTLQEERYCALRSEGSGKRAAYREAFGGDASDGTVDSAVNRLEKRPEIASRIAEMHRDFVEENAALWAQRKEEVCETMFHGIVTAARGGYMTGKETRSNIHDAVKTIGMLADLKGWKEPEKLDIGGSGVGLDTKDVNSKLDKLLALTTKEESKSKVEGEGSTVPSAPQRTEDVSE